ncbi:IS3 family transposase [Orenia metallireducens]
MSYTEDFKQTIVELYQSDNKSKSELAREYGVSRTSINNWIELYAEIDVDENNTITYKEFLAIKKENQRLKQEAEILKKGFNHIREKIDDKQLDTFIDDNKDNYGVKSLCTVLGVARSTYYDRKARPKSNRELENERLEKDIMGIYLNSKKRYGAIKIHKKLSKTGWNVSIKRVQRLMKKLDIRSIVHKKFKHYSSKSEDICGENLLKRDFSTTSINQKWVSDITYIYTVKDSWCYLASIMDLHTRKIIGYAFDKSMTTDLTIKALEKAYSNSKPDKVVILHSDRGTQYTSNTYRNKVKELDLVQSFSGKGNPYDNACIESFHSILKKEEVNHKLYKSFKEANLAIFEFIEAWYNRSRIHGSIDYMTPNEYEKQLKLAS